MKKITIEEKDGKVNLHVEGMASAGEALLMLSQSMTLLLIQKPQQPQVIIPKNAPLNYPIGGKQ